MKIEFLIREEDLLETQLLIASKSNSLRKRRWTGTIFIIACLLVFCLFLNRHMQSFGLFEIIVALAIGIGAGALYYFLIPYIWRRHYVNQVKTHFADIIGNSVELQITDDFIETKDKTGETKVKLTAIKKVYETEKLFVIQSCNGETLTVAKQDIDFVRFRERLIAHGLNIDYQIMKKIIVSAFLCFFLIPSVFSQNGEYVGGASFIKRIEYNLIMLDGVYNLRCGVEEREPFFPRITSGVIHLRHLPVSA